MTRLQPSESLELTRDELRSKRISTEEMVRLQLDRINQLRSDVTNPERIAAWSEALEALEDLLMPWAKLDDKFQTEWEARPVAVITLQGGQRIVIPTAQDCRVAQRILMGLMDRSGLLVKTRTVSGPGPKVKAAPEPDPELPI